MKSNSVFAALAALLALGGCATVSKPVQKSAPVADMGHAAVTVQLKWNHQAQFAYFYAAQEQGFFRDAGLDVTFIPGGPGIVPEQTVASGLAQFGVDWAPHIQVRRAGGLPMVEIAQMFRRSGAMIVMRKSAGLKNLKDLKGKKLGLWLAGNEYEFFPALMKSGLKPNADVTIVNQQDSVTPFVKGELDAVAAMSYNELFRIYNSTNPATGKNYTHEDLSVISLEKEGLGMPEDAIFTSEAQLSTPLGKNVAERFLRAVVRGALYCRNNPADCVGYTLKYAPGADKNEQGWMMSEVNRLIWPSIDGVGKLEMKSLSDMNAELVRNGFIDSGKVSGQGLSAGYINDALGDLRGLDLEGKY
jgi:NitT/TauT family transport system substrate-binding protein